MRLLLYRIVKEQTIDYFHMKTWALKLPSQVNYLYPTKVISVPAASHLEMSSRFKPPFPCPVSGPDTNHIPRHRLFVYPCSPCTPCIFFSSLQNRSRVDNYCTYCSILNVVTTEENRFKVYFIFFLTKEPLVQEG